MVKVFVAQLLINFLKMDILCQLNFALFALYYS